MRDRSVVEVDVDRQPTRLERRPGRRAHFVDIVSFQLYPGAYEALRVTLTRRNPEPGAQNAAQGTGMPCSALALPSCYFPLFPASLRVSLRVSVALSDPCNLLNSGIGIGIGGGRGRGGRKQRDTCRRCAASALQEQRHYTRHGCSQHLHSRGHRLQTPQCGAWFLLPAAAAVAAAAAT